MSLDIYLKSKNPVRHRGTGVFIRKDGATRELETLDEVKKHFPGADLSRIQEYDYMDDELLSLNLTHNLTRMASQVPIAGTEGSVTLPRDFERGHDDFVPKPLTAYNLLWHPETNPLLDNEILHLPEDEIFFERDYEITRLSPEFLRQLMVVYQYINSHREELEKYNPENGWGTYNQLRDATYTLLKAVLEIAQQDAYQDYYIHCWT